MKSISGNPFTDILCRMGSSVLTCLTILTVTLSGWAQAKTDTIYTGNTLTASLVTCYPGPEVYELCGHEALRIRGIYSNGLPVDSVWNYGVFDFNSPNFIYRFVKGETDYMVLGYPFDRFLPEYRNRGSKVVEQDLNLTPEEVEHLRALLQTNSLPANRVYRYNYVKDNCSTRIVDMVDSASTRPIIYPKNAGYKSFRDVMRHYHEGYPWYQFGIDLALGSLIDLPVTSREETFVPVILESKASDAHFEDSDTQLIRETRILNQGVGDARMPATSPWLTPLAASIYLLVICIAVSIFNWRTHTLSRWWFALYFLLLGLSGCVIWFLVFISSHYATSPNILAIWLNPLQLIIPVCIWWRKARPAVTAMIYINILLAVLLLIVWPFQPQSANPAFFPLMTSDIVLCLGYIASGAQFTPARDKNGNRHKGSDNRRSKSNNKNRRNNVNNQRKFILR
ncbi:MAG: DUF4105 domain-containing protein [Muribaculaceae bacterium]|nr:DUF4105 domain-containing protein [Muribaculaceae bacterium]